MTSRARREDLRAEARYRRERLELYRAKTYAGRPTSPAHLRDHERAQAGAKARLHSAEHERANQD
jgi:hypothetical protein